MKEPKLRQARVVHATFLITVPVYALLGELIGPKQAGEYATIRLVFFVASATAAMIGFQFRARMIPGALDALRRNSGDAEAWQRWLSGHTISYIAAEAIALFGVALRFLGGALPESLPFYIVSVGLLLAWMPQRPE